MQVADLRRKMGIKVTGGDVPKPCVSFAHFNFDPLAMALIRKLEYTQPTGLIVIFSKCTMRSCYNHSCLLYVCCIWVCAIFGTDNSSQSRSYPGSSCASRFVRPWCHWCVKSIDLLPPLHHSYASSYPILCLQLFFFCIDRLISSFNTHSFIRIFQL